MIALDAPPRRPSRFTREPRDLAYLALYAVLDGIDAVAEGAVVSTTRFDYVHDRSRIALTVSVFDQDHERLVQVRYTAPPLELAAGLLAITLNRFAGLRVKVIDWGLDAVVPARHKVDKSYLPRRPTADLPTDDLDIVAENYIEQTVGSMLRAFHATNSDGFRWQKNPCWDDPVYGVVGINASVYHTHERLPDDPHGTQKVGGLRVRIVQSGRDLLPVMIDLPAFVQRYGLVLKPACDGNSYWIFLFAHNTPAA